ncbi:CD3324 family protein [Butyrivibrio sp. VCB2006]|uniref:CD3324 family protein n=1 Tax=Butyrivibrio sp. VCB2006 TaxID=1280679 RepID=UPI000427EE29|nr:CD3324 family protein [Butyrivibrio sp. VCB2006]
MKYENAKNILPEKLLEEVQKYAAGKVIYIPKNESSKGWGEASGYRDRLNKRNAMICNRYSAGHSIIEIAEEFYLSPETIKKLVYGKKVNLPMFSPTITSAEHYASQGLGEEWVRTYLSSMDEDVPDYSAFFMTELVKIPLRLIRNGSEDKKTDNNKGIDSKKDIAVIENYSDLPLIVIYENHVFTAPYQQEYLHFLKLEKTNSHYAFVFARNEEYSFFWNNFGKNFQR